jgi:type I restriction enzyme M protein
VDYFTKCVEYDAIAENGYNLSVSFYGVAKDTREVID